MKKDMRCQPWPSLWTNKHNMNILVCRHIYAVDLCIYAKNVLDISLIFIIIIEKLCQSYSDIKMLRIYQSRTGTTEYFLSWYGIGETKISNYRDEWNCFYTVNINSAVRSGSGTVSTSQSQVMASHYWPVSALNSDYKI